MEQRRTLEMTSTPKNMAMTKTNNNNTNTSEDVPRWQRLGCHTRVGQGAAIRVGRIFAYSKVFFLGAKFEVEYVLC